MLVTSLLLNTALIYVNQSKEQDFFFSDSSLKLKGNNKQIISTNGKRISQMKLCRDSFFFFFVTELLKIIRKFQTKILREVLWFFSLSDVLLGFSSLLQRTLSNHSEVYDQSWLLCTLYCLA